MRERRFPVPTMIGACGETITWEDRVMTDDAGHQIALMHVETVSVLMEAISDVKALHRADHEGVISVCLECRKPYPCPTVGVCP